MIRKAICSLIGCYSIRNLYGRILELVSLMSNALLVLALINLSSQRTPCNRVFDEYVFLKLYAQIRLFIILKQPIMIVYSSDGEPMIGVSKMTSKDILGDTHTDRVRLTS